jgi:RNA polymerase sporulation-specific sigma factor
VRHPSPVVPLTDDQRSMVTENLGLVYHMVKRHERLVACVGREDVEQHGLLALCNAARTYDPSRGLKFTTHACCAIRWQLVSLAGETFRDPHRTLLAFDDGELPELAASDDHVEETIERIHRDECAEAVKRALERLKPRHRFIFEAAADGLSHAEIARQMFATPSAVSETLRRVKQILRCRLGASRRAPA